MEFTQEVAKTKKLYKVESSNFPPKETHTKYTYGGLLWKGGNNGIMIDSNGYYWSVSTELIERMDKLLKESQILR
ncbi:hypothetical protein [Clostridium sp.]|uniref:hypothetical protein n=1 Tax=Clostridium sp. TaxID=1506 RepID=UPI0025C4F0B1|nr:hypothetical protein [Clostridium sp.]